MQKKATKPPFPAWYGKCCSCCPWGRLWYVKTNYFSASSKCLGLHESEASVPMAATDPAMDGSRRGERNEDQVNHPRQHGNPLGPPSPSPISYPDHPDQPLALETAAASLFRDGYRGSGRGAYHGHLHKLQRLGPLGN